VTIDGKTHMVPLAAFGTEVLVVKRTANDMDRRR